MAFLALSLAVLFSACVGFWCRRDYWFPLTVYLAAYTLTTGFGVAWILASDGDVLNELTLIQTGQVELSPSLYVLLLLPFVVPLLVMFVTDRAMNLRVFERGMSLLNIEVSPWLYTIEVVALSALVLGGLYQGGFLTLDMLFTSRGYDERVLIRQRLFSSYRATFFGLMYVGLPAFSVCALHQAVFRRGWFWKIATVGSVLVALLALLSTQSKGYILVYVLSLILAAWRLKLLNLRALIGAGVLALVFFVSVTLMEFQKFADLPLGEMVRMLVLFSVMRMAMAVPYYVGLYPEHLGMSASDITQDVIQVMFGPSLGSFGNAPAASHITAYAQGGILYTALVILGAAFYVTVSGKLGEDQTSPIRFSLYIQSLMGLYFLTQVSFMESLLPSYGPSTACLVLAPLLWFAWCSPRQERNIQMLS